MPIFFSLLLSFLYLLRFFTPEAVYAASHTRPHPSGRVGKGSGLLRARYSPLGEFLRVAREHACYYI